MSSLLPGSRVIYTDHPEYGIGTVKFIDEDPLEDSSIYHIAFDWKIDLVSGIESQLQSAPSVNGSMRIPVDALGSARELRRRLGAALIFSENSQSGTFLRSFVTPLPHQAYLLEKVQSHRRWGHLVADDVGMGKTIEAGMLISAALQENPKARVLVLSPKGLVLQWQDELEEHFNQRFSVAGRDFATKEAGLWNQVNLSIASIDTLKQERYQSVLKQCEPFDLIVCDEAHRLTAKRDFLGGDLKRTRSFRFVEWLTTEGIVRWEVDAEGAPRSPRLLLLTATPHQGDDLRFAYLLHLVRPDIVDPDDDKGVPDDAAGLKNCMTRTPKHRAVDWQGKPIFRGHQTTTSDIDLSGDEQEILRLLTAYVQEIMVIDVSGPADALVRALALHTYQKIATSSWTALKASLSARLNGRSGGLDEAGLAQAWESVNGSDLLGDFAGEVSLESERECIQVLLDKLEDLTKDSKLEYFLELVFDTPRFRKPEDKLLVFTQFRETQEYLKISLEERGLSVAVIHGGLSLDERKRERDYFEDSADVMISTEAGSEGANLHRKCHLMVTYDLSWNPMRMLQRIGRLDRFGQKYPVKVVNVRVPDAWDSVVSEKIRVKLESVKDTLSRVADEDYQNMIMGEVYDSIDVGKVMANSKWGNDENAIESQVNQEIDAVLKRQPELERLCNSALGMPEDYADVLAEMGSEEFRKAFSWAAEAHGIKMMETRTSDQSYLKGVYHFTLPDSFRAGLRASRECYLVFDRDRFSEVRGNVLGRARGQEIKPSLAGFGDPVTDWFFRSSLSATDSGVFFAMRKNEIQPENECFWLVTISSWKAASAWRGPDQVFVIALDQDGTRLRRVPGSEVIAILGVSEESSEDVPLEIPSLDQALKASKELLKNRLQSFDGLDRSLLMIVPWMLIRWD